MADKPKFCPCDLGDKFDYQPLGHEVSIEHIKAYLMMPSVQTDAAVIVIHDIFGWRLPNIRYIADLIASNGYIAICPDFFEEQEPWKPSDDWSQLSNWLKSRDPKNIDKETDVVLKYLKEKCNVEKIGVIGFCWGGSVHHLMLKYCVFAAGVSIRGVVILMEDNFNLNSPTFFIAAEKDVLVPLEQITQLTKKLEQECKVDFEVKIYPGQTHGFATAREKILILKINLILKKQGKTCCVGCVDISSNLWI